MSVLAIQGLALFAFIPLVLFLFLQLPLGAGWSLALGLGLMLGHRFVASPWMAAHAAERCLWCARSLPASRLPILVHAGGRDRVMAACGAEHAELVSRFLGCVQRFRILIAIGIFVPLLILLAGTLTL